MLLRAEKTWTWDWCWQRFAGPPVWFLMTLALVAQLIWEHYRR